MNIKFKTIIKLPLGIMSRSKLASIFFAALSFLGFFSVSSAQVIEGDVSLDSQAEVNLFAGNSITGILLIQGYDIVDLSPLSTLDSIGGDLSVRGQSKCATSGHFKIGHP